MGICAHCPICRYRYALSYLFIPYLTSDHISAQCPIYKDMYRDVGMPYITIWFYIVLYMAVNSEWLDLQGSVSACYPYI